MLTIDDVADHWRLRPEAVRARIKREELHAVQIAKRYRMTRNDVWACETGVRPSGVMAARYQTPLMTKGDLARAMQVSVRTVERWMRDGLLTRSVGTNVRFNRAETAAWFRSRFGVDVADLLDEDMPRGA